VECLKRWQSHVFEQSCKAAGADAEETSTRYTRCNVCKHSFRISPFTPPERHRLVRRMTRIGHSRIAPVCHIGFRMMQHYVVSLSLMSGLETAMTSVLTSLFHADTSMPDDRRRTWCTAVLRVMTGLSVMKAVLRRKLTLFSGTVGACTSAMRHLVQRVVTLYGSLFSRLLRVVNFSPSFS